MKEIADIFSHVEDCSQIIKQESDTYMEMLSDFRFSGIIMT